MSKCTLLLGITLQLLIGSHLLNTNIEEDFCSSNVEVLSVFNLGDDIIFQDTTKNLWKLNEVETVSDDSKVFQLMEKTVKVDKKMGDILAKYFDLRYKLFAFTAIDDRNTKCSNGSTAEYEECVEVNTDFNIYYACFFGIKNGVNQQNETQTIEAFKYNYAELQEFETQSLQKRIQDYCRNSTYRGKSHYLIGGLQYYEPDSQHNYTLLKRQLLIHLDTNQSMVTLNSFYEEYDVKNSNQTNQELIKTITFEKTVDSSSVFHVFRYNKIYGIFGCPLNCKITTNLTSINIFEKETPNPIVITIQDLIRCPDFKVWQPNEFCAQTSFQSTFNLGKDIVFQNQGKLWRYISSGANNNGNPYLSTKLQSIRFDSDMLSILNRFFDTSRPMHGFTFRHIVQDMCARTKTSWCQAHFLQFDSLPFYRACIFGENNTHYSPIVQSFYYTPSGLELFESETIASETNQFCSQYIRFLGSDYRLTGILGDHFTNPDGNTDIYVLYRHVPSGRINFYRSTVAQNSDLETLKVNNPNWIWHNISSVEDSRNDSNPVDSVNYHWFYKALVGLSSKDLSDYPIYHSMSDLISRYDWTTGTFKSVSGSIYLLYNCPFEQSYSTAYLEEDPPCTNFDNAYSVFQVVKNVYHQNGKRFYRAILSEGKKRVVFDKYFTDIMNDNFDTRYKVLALSYPLDKYENRVLIVGRTKFNTRSLGEKIFRAFKTGYSELAPLEAVNNPGELDLGHDITFGLKDVDLRYSQFKAMAYLDNGNNYFRDLLELSKYPGKQVESSGLYLMMLVLNHTHLYYTTDTHKFEFPFEDKFLFPTKSVGWIALGLYQNTSPFTDIFGMFTRDNKIYAAAWPPSNETRDKPRIYKIWEYRTSVNRSFFLSPHEKHEYWDFSEYFNCNKSEAASDSSSDDGSNDATYLFIILLILLILMACVVGVIGWDKNKSKTDSDHKSKEDMSSKSNKVSDNSTQAKTDQKNAPQSGQSAEQKGSKVNPLPQNKEIQTPRSGMTSSDDIKSGSGSSIDQIRSNIGD